MKKILGLFTKKLPQHNSKQLEQMTLKEFRVLLDKLRENCKYTDSFTYNKTKLLISLIVRLQDFLYLVDRGEFNYLFKKLK